MLWVGAFGEDRQEHADLDRLQHRAHRPGHPRGDLRPRLDPARRSVPRDRGGCGRSRFGAPLPSLGTAAVKATPRLIGPLSVSRHDPAFSCTHPDDLVRVHVASVGPVSRAWEVRPASRVGDDDGCLGQLVGNATSRDCVNPEMLDQGSRRRTRVVHRRRQRADSRPPVLASREAAHEGVLATQVIPLYGY